MIAYFFFYEYSLKIRISIFLYLNILQLVKNFQRKQQTVLILDTLPKLRKFTLLVKVLTFEIFLFQLLHGDFICFVACLQHIHTILVRNPKFLSQGILPYTTQIKHHLQQYTNIYTVVVHVSMLYMLAIYQNFIFFGILVCISSTW